MPVITEDRVLTEPRVRDRRVGLVPMILTALVTFLLGFGIGQSVEENNRDVLPGGVPTDNISGHSASDR